MSESYDNAKIQGLIDDCEEIQGALLMIIAERDAALLREKRLIESNAEQRDQLRKWVKQAYLEGYADANGDWHGTSKAWLASHSRKGIKASHD